MVNSNYLKDIDVVILCGGKGSRLCQITQNIPKPMLEIDHRPFLDILIDYTSSYGFKRFILCTGYKGNIIKNYYRTKRKALNIVFSREEKPLGTGGAIKNAAILIQSNPFLVMNGDSFCKVDLQKFAEFHIERRALVSIALIGSKKEKGYGSVNLNRLQQITRFSEKSNKNRDGYVNAGIYFFDNQVFSIIPHQNNFSLEYDFFPKIKEMPCYGYVTKSELYDIGTPERYEKAKNFFRSRVDLGSSK